MFALYDVMQTIMEETESTSDWCWKGYVRWYSASCSRNKGQAQDWSQLPRYDSQCRSRKLWYTTEPANELEAIQQLQEDYITAMVENTKFTRKKLEKLLNEKVNIYLSAEEAVRYGLADEIMRNRDV